MYSWKGLRVLVTGGASFIGSRLVDALVRRECKVRVVDDLSGGASENIKSHLFANAIEFIQADLRDPGVARVAVSGMDMVFHLASDHGGRGYVDMRQAGPASNMLLGGMVFREARLAGVKKVIFSSSGCVYPNFLQSDTSEILYLKEDMVKPPYDADNMYGWAKLMNELTLQHYYKEYGMKSAICRFFTVYGPRGLETHAVIAMIARAFIGQDPFEVWGTGEQVRNWTYVTDIVRGLVMAAEKIDDATPINLGTMERIRVIDAAKMILEHTGHKATIKFLLDKPTGPLNRVADNALAKELLGWEPLVSFADGVKETSDWYFATKDRNEVRRTLERALLERRNVTEYTRRIA